MPTSRSSPRSNDSHRRGDGSFVGVMIPAHSGSPSVSSKGASTSASAAHTSSTSSTASATADTSLSSSTRSTDAPAKRPVMTARPIPTIVVPPLANGTASPAPKSWLVVDDDDDDLTSLDSDSDNMAVAARPILGSKPPNAKKDGVDGEAKPKKRKGKDAVEGGAKPKKAKVATGVAGTSAGASGEGKTKTRAPKGTFIRCHQCRTDFANAADSMSKLLQCSKLKPRTLTKAECDAKGLDRSKAPTVMERCKTTWCPKCLRSRYGHDISQIRVDDSDDDYDWECPVCIGDCNCSTCRKKAGLAPTGFIDLQEVGATSVRELLARDPKAKGKHPGQTPAKKEEADKLLRVKALGKKAKSNRSREGSSPLTPLSDDSSDLSDVPSTTEGKTASKSGPSKVVPRRAPRTVLAPKLVTPLSTQNLSSPHLLVRVNIREFVIRFRHLLPGLGRDDKNKAEVERAEKILESMDDPANFWTDDESGMRTVVAGLVGVIEKEETKTAGAIFEDAEEDYLDEVLDLMTQIKRELKVGVTANYNSQGAVQCWETCSRLLKLEGFADRLATETEGAFIAMEDETVEERRAHYRIRPEEKVAIVAAFVELALRCEVVRDDIVNGLERERLAKADIVKRRAKVNKSWAETKAKLGSKKPPTESLLDPKKSPSKQSVKAKAAEEERLAALEEWDEEMREREQEHKRQIRLFGIAQYLAGTSNRLRFDLIGKDTRGNEYFVLSETPGRAYPSNRSELAWSWSYNLVVHGSAPDDSRIPKTARFAKGNGISSAGTASAPLSRVPSATHTDSDVDMLEGSDRAEDDQWLRVSEPHEIRQLASWINYEAILLDRRRESPEPGDVVEPDDAEDEGVSKDGGREKQVAELVDRCHSFAEFLDLRVAEAETGLREAARAGGRGGRRARAPIFGVL